MKKIYNSPAMLCVELRTVNMMATSEQSFSGFKETAVIGSAGDDIDVKETSNVNVWDEEW